MSIQVGSAGGAGLVDVQIDTKPINFDDIIRKKSLVKKDDWKPDPTIPQTANIPENLIRQYYDIAAKARSRMARNDNMIKRNK